MSVGGVQRPKNENLSNIVDQEREAIQMRQEPRDPGMSRKGKRILIIGGLVLVVVYGLFMLLIISR